MYGSFAPAGAVMEEIMKKVQRILAVLGVILLLGLYLATLIFALLGKNFFPMFMADLFSSFVLPVLLWVYGFVYRLIKKNTSEDTVTHEAQSSENNGDTPSL